MVVHCAKCKQKKWGKKRFILPPHRPHSGLVRCHINLHLTLISGTTSKYGQSCKNEITGILKYCVVPLL